MLAEEQLRQQLARAERDVTAAISKLERALDILKAVAAGAPHLKEFASGEPAFVLDVARHIQLSVGQVNEAAALVSEIER